jgi:hypothetical protein
MFRTFTAIVALFLIIVLTAAAHAVQASPRAASQQCVAPPLPPGEVTPPETASSSAEEPASETDETDPAPTPIPAGMPADQATIDRFIAAEENLNACLNSGDYEAAAALFSPHGLEYFFGSPNPYDAAANLAGYPQLALHSVDNVEVLPDGRLRGEVTYTVGAQLAGDVEYWVDQDGVLLLDHFTELPHPLQAPAGAPVIDLAMIDYAFALSEHTVPAAAAIVFHTSIDSATASDHVATLIGCPEGTTAEQLITGEIDYVTACPSSYGQQYLRPGQDETDMILIGLEPGTYFFVCDVVTPAGHLHQMLGMVAAVTIT